MKRGKNFGWIAIITLAGSVFGHAAVYHVQQEKGSDTHEGTEASPLQTIKAAIAKAGAGDTIRLLPHTGAIHQNIVIDGKSGEAGKPITFDGNGQTLSGLLPAEIKAWEEISPGLYRSRVLPELLKNDKARKSRIRRFFFTIQDRIVQPDRGSKRPGQPWKTPESLLPGEWSWSESEKALYLRLPEGTTWQEARIAYPALENGLATRGEVAHWEVHDLTVRGFINDGYNFHGNTQQFRLRNINAFQCGDDGMSAHGTCAVEVENFVSRENSTGICHIDASESVSRGVTLEGNRSYNLYLLGSGKHTLIGSSISALDGGIRLLTKKDEGLRIELRDCTFPGEGEAGAAFEVSPEVSLLREPLAATAAQ